MLSCTIQKKIALTGSSTQLAGVELLDVISARFVALVDHLMLLTIQPRPFETSTPSTSASQNANSTQTSKHAVSGTYVSDGVTSSMPIENPRLPK